MVSFHSGRKSWVESCRDLCGVLMLFNDPKQEKMKWQYSQIIPSCSDQWVQDWLWELQKDVIRVNDGMTKWSVKFIVGNHEVLYMGKSNPNFVSKIMAFKVIATSRMSFFRFLTVCCMKASSQFLLLITLTHWKLEIIRKGIKIKTKQHVAITETHAVPAS